MFTRHDQGDGLSLMSDVFVWLKTAGCLNAQILTFCVPDFKQTLVEIIYQIPLNVETGYSFQEAFTNMHNLCF